MQACNVFYQLHLYIFFHFLVSLSLTASFQSSLKTRIKLHKIAYEMSKNCLRGWGWGWGLAEKGGRHENGGERNGCWEDRRSWKTEKVYIFFSFFGVIIPECQLPKFTENTHKIAQNCIWNVQKLFAGVKGWGEGWRKRGEDMTMGGPAQWLLGDRRPWKTEKVVNGFCRNFLEGYVGHGPETNEFNFGDDPHHYPDPGRTATIILCWLAFGLGLCCLSTSSYYKRAFWNKQCMLKTVLQLRRKYRDICEVYGISHIATWTIRGICNSGILPISNDNVDSFVSQLLCCLPH